MIRSRFGGTTTAIVVLLLLGGCAAILLGVLWSTEPKKDTLAYETAKTCLQVIGLVVFGGAIGLATSGVENSRQERAAERQASDARRAAERQDADARQAAEQQAREESFKIRTDLLDRGARCAATMFVTCRYVERLQDAGQRGSQPAHGPDVTRASALTLLDERYLAFAADGLTLQTEIDARFCSRSSEIPADEDDPGARGASSLRWHQVFDLLTLYYFSLTGTFPQNVLVEFSQDDAQLHSGLRLVDEVRDAIAPTAEELAKARVAVKTKYVRTMPLLADALLAEPLGVHEPGEAPVAVGHSNA